MNSTWRSWARRVADRRDGPRRGGGGQRNGTVTALDVGGVLRYVEESSNRYLMGCVRCPCRHQCTRGAALRGIRDELRNRHRGDAWSSPRRIGRRRCAARRHRTARQAGRAAADARVSAIGARVHGEPAIDSVFDCGDFLTLLDAEEADSRYRERLTDTVRRLSVAAG